MIEPPLNKREIRALTAFFGSRRIQTRGGPLDSRTLGAGHEDVISYTDPPEGQPNLHCDLKISEDGKNLEWNGNGDSGPDLDKWIVYIVDHLLKPDAEFDIRERNFDLDEMSDEDLLRYFSFDHFVNGILSSEAMVGDTWKIFVIDNEVSVVREPVFKPLDATTEVDEDDEDE
jgi:hypothetical protein